MGEQELTRLRGVARRLRVKPGTRVSVNRDFDPADTGGFSGPSDAVRELQAGIELIAEYQDRLSAQSTYSVLLVLQGLDASGKDGAVKHVMTGVNPSGVRVCSFKQPTLEELRHTFLWRYGRELPDRGTIGIFNRSHYEEVLVVRVHRDLLERQYLPPDALHGDVWARRFRDINEWERHLVDNGVRIVKAFLNVSREEQRRRFLERIDDPAKNWKFTANDVHERHFWDDYMKAYSDVLTHTSTAAAPWHVVPADHKWYARLSVAALLVDALVRIDPRYPVTTADERKALVAAREQLIAEDGATARSR